MSRCPVRAGTYQCDHDEGHVGAHETQQRPPRWVGAAPRPIRRADAFQDTGVSANALASPRPATTLPQNAPAARPASDVLVAGMSGEAPPPEAA